MQQDNLIDIEELAYAKKYRKSPIILIIIFSGVFFFLGFTVAKLYYHDYPLFLEIKQNQEKFRKEHPELN